MKKFYARCTPWGTIQTGAYFELLPEDQQLAVLAHEMGHLAGLHSWKRVWWMLTLKAFFKNNAYWVMCRQQELEADVHAARYYKKALCAFISRLPDVKSDSHPSKQERLARLS